MNTCPHLTKKLLLNRYFKSVNWQCTCWYVNQKSTNFCYSSSTSAISKMWYLYLQSGSGHILSWWSVTEMYFSYVFQNWKKLFAGDSALKMGFAGIIAWEIWLLNRLCERKNLKNKVICLRRSSRKKERGSLDVKGWIQWPKKESPHLRKWRNEDQKKTSG